jgi:hypothetical protein
MTEFFELFNFILGALMAALLAPLFLPLQIFGYPIFKIMENVTSK